MISTLSIETLVDELKTDYHRSQFESLFKRKTEHLSGPEKLKIRMQITELAKPALGIVDLRKKVPAEVEPYIFQGRTHYFDLTARKVFEEGLRAYKGIFTNDTKQKILALKAHHQQLAEDKAQAQDEQDGALDNFVAGRAYERREERMNLVTSAVMALTDGQKFSTMTVDISNYGLQLKLALDPQLAGLKHGRIKVYFSGLANDVVFDESVGFDYRVVGVKEKDQCLYLRLKRLDESENDELSKLLSGMLTRFRRRYKINVEHLAQRVTARGHENYWFDAIQALPLLFSNNAATCAVVRTEANQTLLNSWQQHQHDLLPELIEQPWVQSVVSSLQYSRKVTREQVTFFRLSLPVNKVWREYLLPLHVIREEKGLIATLNALRIAGYGVRCYQLTLTYIKEKQLTYAELNAIKTPRWQHISSSQPKLSALQNYRTQGANHFDYKVLSSGESVKQQVFCSVLSSALFFYKNGIEWQPKLTGLMPCADGLSKLLAEPRFWLASGNRILGGRRLASELTRALRRLPENDKLSSRILLLRTTNTAQKDGVMGRDIQEYSSFEEAAEYIRFLNEDHNFVALMVSGKACDNQLPMELNKDLSYIQRYLPHRAKELELGFKQLRAVMTLTDVTQTLADLAELTA